MPAFITAPSAKSPEQERDALTVLTPCDANHNYYHLFERRVTGLKACQSPLRYNSREINNR